MRDSVVKSLLVCTHCRPECCSRRSPPTGWQSRCQTAPGRTGGVFRCWWLRSRWSGDHFGGREWQINTNPSVRFQSRRCVEYCVKGLSYISVVVDVHVGRGQLSGLVLESRILVGQLDASLSQGLTHRPVLRQRDPEEEGSKNTKNSDFPWLRKWTLKSGNTMCLSYLTIPSANTAQTKRATRHFMIPRVRTALLDGYDPAGIWTGFIYARLHLYQPDRSQTISDITSDRVTLGAFFLRSYILNMHILIINSINTTCDSHTL